MVDSDVVEGAVVVPPAEPLLDFDSFVSIDGIGAVTANGLMVWIYGQGGVVPRPLSAWRGLLAIFMGLR